MKKRTFHVLIATDGSAPASAALETAARFPWPHRHRATALIVGSPADGDNRRERLLESTRRQLPRGWKRAGVVWRVGTPARAILNVRAHVIAMGWRGHGPMGRIFMGSTSRAVLKKAAVPVLVVKHSPRGTHRVLVGLDGSKEASHAIAFLGRCQPRRRWTAVLLSVVVPLYAPRHGLLPSALVEAVRAEVAARNARAKLEARRRLEQAAQHLRSAGWRVRPLLTQGDPLTELLATATAQHADIVIVGAGPRAVASGRLGRVTQGTLARCPVPVLVVR